MRKLLMSIFATVIAVGLVACGGDSEEKKDVQFTISDEEKYNENEKIATVNGEDIKGITYNLVYSQLKLHAQQLADEVSLDELEEKTIESLIDRTLLMQEAKEQGISYSDEEVDQELLRLKEENEDILETILQQYQITEELFHEQLKFELTMEDFIVEEIEVEVTDAEIEEVYEEIKEENEDVPELVEIRDTLKFRIEGDKKQQALEQRISKIRDESDIELHI